MSKNLSPLESEEAKVLVEYLTTIGLKFHHSPNETGSSPEARRRALRMKREGTSPGFPDYLILIPPNRSVDGKGWLLIVELKRAQGGTLSADQREWLAVFNALGIEHVEAVRSNGAQDTIEWIQSLLKPLSNSQIF